MVEELLARALRTAMIAVGTEGSYLPLTGSTTWASSPTGMTEHQETMLQDGGNLFMEPDSTITLSGGFGRDWPHARGVFLSKDKSIVAWINEEDHLRIFSKHKSADLKAVFGRLCAVEGHVRIALEREGVEFATSNSLGYLTSCPAELGTAMKAEVTLSLPHFGTRIGELRAVCASLRLQVQENDSVLWKVSNSERYGTSEVEQVNTVLEGAAALLHMEVQLAALVAERGFPPQQEVELIVSAARQRATHLRKCSQASVDPATLFSEKYVEPVEDDESEEGNLPDYAARPGLGAEDYPGFPIDATPEDMPDLTHHFNMMAEVLNRDSSIYRSLQSVVTQKGVTLARCIKPGVDSPGHPMISSIGLNAGDAESYDVFRPLFDPVVTALHGVDASPQHLNPNANDAPVEGTLVDPLSGALKLSVTVKVQRNLVAFPFPPAMTKQQRQEVESTLVAVLRRLSTEDLKGEYFPIRGSGSNPDRLQGMSEEEEDRLDETGLLFREPDATMDLASGLGRDWPDARGVFMADHEQFAAWINEEDHLCLWSVEDSSDLNAAFARLRRAEGLLRSGLQECGHAFAFSDRLGYLTSCPSNLGSALCVEVDVRLQLLPQQQGFRELLKRLGVVAQSAARASPDSGSPSSEERSWQVSNAHRLGSTEAEQASTVIAALSRMMDLEVLLRRGERIDLAKIAPDPTEDL